jgi:tetratricopeptide (TPR) repeat protein
VLGRRTVIRWAVIGGIVTVAGVAFQSWRAHERVAIAIAGVPKIPDLSRWPGGFARAVRSASAAVHEERNPIEPLARLAGLYHANVYNAQAVRVLSALRRLDPKNSRWAYLLADLRLRVGEWDAAAQVLRQTLELDPQYSPAWFRLAKLLAIRGEIDAARECYARAVATAPEDLLTRYIQIGFEAAYGNASESRRRLGELVRANPDYPALHASLAELHAQSGDLESAARERLLASTTRRQLVQRDPWVEELAEFSFDVSQLSLLANTATRERRFDVAENLLIKAILIAPFEPSLWGSLGSVYQNAGRPGDALRLSKFAIAIIPDDPGLRAKQAALLCDLARPKQAISRLQPALQRWPEEADLHVALGVALGISGKPEAAASALREAIHLDPTLLEAQFLLAVSLYELGQFDASRKAAQKALLIRPEYSVALSLLASIALKSADLAAAESKVKQLLMLNPGANARSLVASLEPYLRFEPGNTDAYLLLGEVLRDAGRVDDARAIFQQGFQMTRKNGHADQAVRFRQALERLRDDAIHDQNA